MKRILYLGVLCTVFCSNLSIWADEPNVFGVADTDRRERLREEFYKAVESRNLIALRALLEEGISPDTVKNPREMSALTVAAFRNEKEMAKLLLDYGANPNYVSTGDLSPLIYCFTRKNKNIEIARMLLEYGADVNFVSRIYKVSVLDDALTRDYKDAGVLLRSYGGELYRHKTHANVSTQEWRNVLAIKPSKKKFRYPSFGGKRPATQEELLLAIKKNPKDFVGEQTFMLLVQDGCIDGVRELLKAGCNPNVPVDGLYPIVEASRVKNFELVNLLLDYGADPHVVDAKKFNAVTYLIAEQGVPVPTEENLRILRLFLEYGYKTNAKNGWGSSALKDCCFHRKIEQLKLLVAFGAATLEKLSSGNPQIQSALNGAQTLFPSKRPTHGGTRVVREEKPEPETPSKLVSTPPLAQQEEVVQKLEVDVHKRHPNGQTELHVACGSGDVALAKALVEQGADLLHKDNLGKTPLHILCSGKASSRKFVEILTLITEQEPSALGQKDNTGRIPFHYLCESKNSTYEVAEMIKLDPRQVNLREAKNDRRTPLLIALAQKNNKTALVLLENDADPTQSLRDGQTALHLAAGEMLLDVVDCLTKSGVSGLIDARDKARMTPFLRACEVYSYSSSSDRTAQKQIGILKLLVERGANPKLVNKNRENALHVCVRYAHPSVVEFLLSLEVGVNAKDKRGHTPLYRARYGYNSVRQMLERHGAEE